MLAIAQSGCALSPLAQNMETESRLNTSSLGRPGTGADLAFYYAVPPTTAPTGSTETRGSAVERYASPYSLREKGLVFDGRLQASFSALEKSVVDRAGNPMLTTTMVWNTLRLQESTNQQARPKDCYLSSPVSKHLLILFTVHSFSLMGYYAYWTVSWKHSY